MPGATPPCRVLELRSVRGTGGGPEKTILLGSARTDPSRYAITVCYIRDARDEVFHIDRRADGLPIDYVEVWEKHSLDPGIWKPLVNLVKDRRIDIVHGHEYKTDLLAYLLARRLPVIPLATAHGWTGHSAQELRVYYPADRWLLARFPRVIAVSSEIKATLVRSGAAPNRVSVVLNGIDHEAFRREPARRDEARRRFGLEPGDVAIGAVGRLEPQKNLPLLLQAFERLAGRFPSAMLLIAGDGSLRQELEVRRSRMRAASRCRLLGHVDDVATLHHALDALVQASDYEGTPNAVLEAMAFETPLLATDVGGTSELARDRVEALIVPPRSEEALVTALAELLGDSDAARARARAARCRVETELSFARRMGRVEAIYEQLMSEYRVVRQGQRKGETRDA